MRVDEPITDEASSAGPGLRGLGMLEAGVSSGSAEPSLDPEVDRIRVLLAERMLGVALAQPRIGRYEIVERLGAGGMGVVYVAYDDQLDRKVAIKLLHPEHDTEAVRQRLRREAQAMARIVHENVATVYEVGEHRGRAFVVMEYVRGATLRAWQKDATPRAIVEHYMQAGRGLAAAHATGMVHRDFKPDNAIIGDDGRVRVLDFGLARADGFGAPDIVADVSCDDNPLVTPLTRTGAMIGTPAYMSPEQIRGEPAGPAADQFAFCVALFEALYGERPFAGDKLDQLYAAAMDGRVRALSTSRGVPPHLHAVLLRGLAADADARWPDMQALLGALARDPSRRRRRALAVAGVAVIATASVGVVQLQQRVARARAIASCEADADLSSSWNDETRAEVRAGLSDTSGAYVGSTVDRVLPALDEYAAAWSQSYDASCRATQVERTQSTDAFDRASWCLAERRLALEAVVEQLANANGEITAHAISAVLDLPRIDACADAELLVRLPAPPSEHRADVQSVRAEIARTAAMLSSGRHADGLAHARENLDAAAALGWPPLSAAARASLGHALVKAARYQEAETELAAAYFEALEAGAPEIAVDTSIALVRTVGVQLARREDGLAWSRHAESALASLGDRDGLGTAQLLVASTELHVATMRLSEAQVLAERALAIRERLLGPDHPAVGEASYALALAQLQGDRLAARPHARRAVQIAEAVFGPAHPDLVPRLTLLSETTDAAEAMATVEHALELGERELGDHPDVAAALVVLARHVYWTEGKGPAVAKPYLERALAIQTRTLGPRHADVARTINLLGMCAHPSDEAVALYQHALAIAEESLGPNHPFVAPPLYNLAEVHQLRGEFDLAAPLIRRAVDVRRVVFGADEPRYGGYLLKLSRVQICREDWTAADEVVDEMERMDALGGPPTDHANTTTWILRAEVELGRGDAIAAYAALRELEAIAAHCEAGAKEVASVGFDFLLARVLWVLPEHEGRDRARALRLAKQARAYQADHAQPWGEDACTDRAGRLAEIDAWIAAHR